MVTLSEAGKSLHEKYQLEKWFRFVGVTKDSLILYVATKHPSDLPSHWEGFKLAIQVTGKIKAQ